MTLERSRTRYRSGSSGSFGSAPLVGGWQWQPSKGASCCKATRSFVCSLRATVAYGNPSTGGPVRSHGHAVLEEGEALAEVTGLAGRGVREHRAVERHPYLADGHALVLA